MRAKTLCVWHSLHTAWVYKVDRICVGVAVSVVENEFANSTVDRIAAHITVVVEERMEFANSITICVPPVPMDRPKIGLLRDAGTISRR